MAGAIGSPIWARIFFCSCRGHAGLSSTTCDLLLGGVVDVLHCTAHLATDRVDAVLIKAGVACTASNALVGTPGADVPALDRLQVIAEHKRLLAGQTLE